ncbi:uncharacterized protein LAESUDRAFT_415062 [Laetiporus sulphureus 93-53]|uniref:Uncharacterized protein n=1 Tax=Laetiporus sulphureus 93-53 TaxID=1314785 RepID=A0A165C8I4_9APHY|nr:uncharacterized protein LAESUDRAFT_415062 [Laetiporus sulphureus 93-53]KZT02386.1 hypothetical protein LAESUDRAFT_415062 [Laetiporus sulphureus 93-53]
MISVRLFRSSTHQASPPTPTATSCIDMHSIRNPRKPSSDPPKVPPTDPPLASAAPATCAGANQKASVLRNHNTGSHFSTCGRGPDSREPSSPRRSRDRVSLSQWKRRHPDRAHICVRVWIRSVRGCMGSCEIKWWWEWEHLVMMHDECEGDVGTDTCQFLSFNTRG